MSNPENRLQRRAYHQAFIEWLTTCSTEEAECFDQLQRHKPAHQVIPMMQFMAECLADPDRRDLLPKGLVERLKAVSWPPAMSVCEAA